MLTQHIALVPETTEVSLDELHQVSAAISMQVTRDFAKIWSVEATVDPFANSSLVPVGYWKITILTSDSPGDAGFHTALNKQPAAFVKYASDWSLRASHEVLEILADPYGNKKYAGPSVRNDASLVEYLVEVCDPCERVSYEINGTEVADFCTPPYYDAQAAPGTRYSFTGAIKKPREVLAGGYLTWQDPATNLMWQLQYFGDQPRVVQVEGDAMGSRSLRELVDLITRQRRYARHSSKKKRPSVRRIQRKTKGDSS